jgi:transposase-like protein
MDLTQLSPAVLTELIQLVQEKSDLASRIQAIDAQMERLVSGKAAAPAVKSAPVAKETVPVKVRAKSSAPRAPRGALKEGILQALKEAGAAGVNVSELASKLGVDAKNIHVWFSTTGKKVAGLTKLGAGHFALANGSAAPELAAVANEIAASETAPEVVVVETVVNEVFVESTPEGIIVEESPVTIVEETVFVVEPTAAAETGETFPTEPAFEAAPEEKPHHGGEGAQFELSSNE